MNTPILPGMMDTYVRQHQHELEQKAQVDELFRQAAEANGPGRVSRMAAPLGRLARLFTAVPGRAKHEGQGASARQGVEART